jgi:exopolysaccharide biosynthesis polyprenyl glycosylphosphotransferase
VTASPPYPAVGLSGAGSAADPGPSEAAAPAREWAQRYAFYLFLLDLTILGVTGIVAVFLRFGTDGGEALRLSGVSYFLIAAAVVVAWLGTLGFSRCYESRFLGTGSEEYTRVGNASVRLAAVVALVAFALDLPLSRGFVAVLLLLGTLLLLVGRVAARACLRAGRRRGRWNHRVLVVGGIQQVQELVEQLSRDPSAGFDVVAVCVPGEHRAALRLSNGDSVPVSGGLSSVTQVMLDLRADTVAVTGSPGITGHALRRLSYELEGSGVDLLVAPALTNVTGSRVSIRPMAGLPLLHLDEPELTGARRVLKLVFDLVVALVLTVVLSPLLLALGFLVRLTSPGPAIFTQERVGRRGRPFRIYKFRSMYVDAEERLAELAHLNEHDGVLFKLRNDPRVTPLGRLLRRYSLDELPQLLNVLRGQMSLVGPRPPLASEVARYEGHAHRRLLVKPGVTGLWQVSGRSDLSWDDTVRLDLQYVENWSLGLDISVLAKTAVTVLRRSGAY